MNKKVVTIFIVLLISLCCLSIISAEDANNSSENNDDVQIDETAVPAETEEIDLSNYITIVSQANGQIEFSDGYSGFAIDASKSAASSDDGFSSQPTSGIGSLANYIKLAIIEAYKTGNEDNLPAIISSFADGSYANGGNEVVDNVLNSNEQIPDQYTVMIDNTTEATFDFELLSPIDDGTSQYFAYKVSTRTVEDEKLSSSEIETEEENLTSPEDENADQPAESSESDEVSQNGTSEIVKNESGNNQQDDTNTDNNQSEGNTVINETNKTIVNKTNTTVINQKNTTIINENNVKTINRTNDNTNATPVQETIMKAAGNPIVILIAVLVLGGAVALVMHKKD